jgi:hypothetical protein
MKITGVTLDQFRDLVTDVSNALYNGNVRVHQDAHPISGRTIRARLDVHDSHRHGARTSLSGRHTPAASWEAYRDVLAELFARYPTAKVITGIATYHGVEGFNANYPATAYRNVGSPLYPVTMPELSI